LCEPRLITQFMGIFQPITDVYFPPYIKSRNFTKRQCEWQWLTPPNKLSLHLWYPERRSAHTLTPSAPASEPISVGGSVLRPSRRFFLAGYWSGAFDTISTISDPARRLSCSILGPLDRVCQPRLRRNAHTGPMVKNLFSADACFRRRGERGCLWINHVSTDA